MPPVSYKPKGSGGFAKSYGFKTTVKKLAHYYSDYKKMFIVAIILALIGGAASTAGIIMNGFLYSRYIIPFNSVLISSGVVDPTSFILTSFI
ncbi:hypothetical protein FACS1894218_1830 [Bacilli bacterium]|nr:hypothetical protein FACS1894218_1830 [Bacilli bacterium]